jgi:hypothetical protein
MAAVVMAVAAGLALAVPAAAATTVAVDAGYGARYVPGEPLPVRVTVAADRLVAATLEVGVEGTTPLSVEVEVPGGSQKQYVVTIPTSAAQGAPALNVGARLVDGSQAPPAGRTTVTAARDEELVGLLPGALAGRAVPGPAPLAVDAGTARFFALGPGELDRAPASLGPLGTIAAGPDELDRLPAATRAAVVRWVEEGGRLLVDGRPGGRVAGVPEPWQPGEQGRAAAGLGEVRLVGDAIAAGRWAGLVEPSPKGAGVGGGGAPFNLAGSLAAEAGFRVPRLTWLLGFLVLYLVVVGPALYVVLRRRGRQELAWAAIPLVAVVFTTASYVAGQGARTATHAVHGTVLTTGESGTWALSHVGVASRSGETVRVALPGGWLPRADLQFQRIGPLPSAVAERPSGTEVRLPLDAGQFGVVAAEGPVELTGRLEVSGASPADGEAGGTVRNTTGTALEAVAVFAGNRGVLVGDLRPGQEKEWRVSPAVGQFDGPTPAFRVWGPIGGEFGAGGLVDLALWEAAQLAGAPARPGGMAVAAGWTRDYDPPVRVGGRSSPGDGRTLVLGHGPVRPGGATLTDLAVGVEVVRGWTNDEWRGPVPIGPQDRSVVRFTLPPGAAPDPASLRLQSLSAQAEVWDGSGWVGLVCGAGCPGAGPNVVGGVIARPGPPFTIPPCPPGAACDLPALPAPQRVIAGGQGGFSLPLTGAALDGGVLHVRMVGGVVPGFVSLRHAAQP